MQSEVPMPQQQPAVMISTSAGAVVQKAIDSHRGRQLNGRLVVSKACLTDENRWHKLHKLEHADTAAIEVINAAAAVTEAAGVEVATASSGSSGSSSTTARRLLHTHDQQQQQQPAVALHSSDSSSTVVDSTATGITASTMHDGSDSTTITHDDDDVTTAGVTAQLQQREVLSGTLQVSDTTDKIEFIR
jgi:predicted component of type VI protein secretion system